MVRVEMARPLPSPRLTTVSRLKAIVTFVERTEGEQAAQSLLASLSLRRALLEDETRALPLATFQAALVWLVHRSGKEALFELAEDILHDENLGVFAALLRDAESLDSAFVKFEPLARGLRFETLAKAPGLFHGRLPLEPSMELARHFIAAELRALPPLFGREKGRVEIRDGGEFVVRWKEPSAWPASLLAVSGSLLVAALAIRYEAASLRALLPVFVACVGFASFLWSSGRSRRLESRAQRMRIRVLERSMALGERRRASPARYEEGAILAGEYLLEERLGAGGHAVIWRAQRLSDGTAVAMKLLRTAAADDPVAADRLSREAEALALSRHPNVVELHDHGLLPDGTAYLVLEHLSGESLATKLERKGPLSPEALAPMALALCDALVAVHAAGVVHRDLSPANVFLSREEGGGQKLKLLDFGIAHVEWAETRLTNPGRPLGTPGFMSKEQAEGGRVDARSDLYSLGAVLEACLPASSRIPPAWREVIERAKAELPAERYRDARQMREAIVGAMGAG